MFNNFNEEEIQVYEKIGQKIKIRKEVDNINEKIEVLKVKEDIEGVSMADEIKKLIDRRDLLSEEEKDVGNSEEYILIIGKLDEIKSLKKRLKKLEEKKGSISENVYTKLKQEYEDDYKKNELLLLKETEKIKKLNEEVSTFIKNIDLLREEEKLRFDLNEYTEEQYNELTDKLSKNEKRAEAILYATSVLVDEFTNELQ